ncbi:MAG: ribonuclease P protein component [Planctomycetota bacterium]|nr:ribonuclease P protein component [Planctomycetota bacterium]
MPSPSLVRKPGGFTRPMRMLKTPEFDRAFRGGSRARADHLLVICVEARFGHTRLGLSVGKRIFKLAKDRNRLKRVLREAFRQNYGSIPDGVDLVIVPGKPGCAPSVEQAGKELVYLANKAHKRLLEKRAKATDGERSA